MTAINNPLSAAKTLLVDGGFEPDVAENATTAIAIELRETNENLTKLVKRFNRPSPARKQFHVVEESSVNAFDCTLNELSALGWFIDEVDLANFRALLSKGNYA